MAAIVVIEVKLFSSCGFSL